MKNPVTKPKGETPTLQPAAPTTNSYTSMTFPGDSGSSASSSLNIFVRTLAGKTLCLEVRPSDTIEQVKSKLQSKKEALSCLLPLPKTYPKPRLSCGGRELYDKQTLLDYNIQKNGTLQELCPVVPTTSATASAFDRKLANQEKKKDVSQEDNFCATRPKSAKVILPDVSRNSSSSSKQDEEIFDGLNSSSSRSSSRSNVSIKKGAEEPFNNPLEIRIFARKGLKGFSENINSMQQGVIDYINGEKGFGKIKAKSGGKVNIFFHISSVVNSLGSEVVLQEGSTVLFKLGNQMDDKPKASIVYITSQSIVHPTTTKVKGSGGGWLKGEIVSTKEHFLFIHPEEPLPSIYPKNKDVYMRRDILSKHVLSPNVGDFIEFRLGARNPEKPEARNAKVLVYQKRTETELVSYIANMTEKVEEEPSIIGDLLAAKGLWKLFSDQSCVANMCDDLASYFLNFFEAVLHNASVHKQAAKELVQALSAMPFFKPPGSLLILVKKRSVHYSSVCQTLYVMASLYPEFNASCFSFLQAMNDEEVSEDMQSWMLKFYKLALCHNPILDMSATGNWSSLPLVPLSDEMMGTPLESDVHLSPVKHNNPYDSSEEYMDTYFRLLRTECFSGMQSGIKSLLSGELDERDMRVYHKVAVTGFCASRASLNIAVSFQTIQPVKNWEKSPHFMFGNLICLSPSGNFKDPIWATVADKDSDLLNKQQTIQLQLCSEFNTLSTSEVLMKLTASSGFTVMVESPLYFHSIRPVLQSLQQFDMDSFPLMNEVIHCEDSQEFPDFITEDSVFDVSSIFKPRIPGCESFTLENLENNIHMSILDESQQVALLESLRNPLAIIQGPPGCGKTFIGTALVKILLSIKPRPRLPILLLTYKNHALDEFLKDSLTFLPPNEIARVGGRSKEEKLDACNLKELKKTCPKSKAIQSELSAVWEEKDEVSKDVTDVLQDLKLSSVLTYLDILESLEEDQLVMWLEKTPYSKKQAAGMVTHKINKNTFVDQKFVRDIIIKVRQKYKSLKDFLLNHDGSDSHEKALSELFKITVNVWRPSLDKIKDLKQMQDQYITDIKRANAEMEKDDIKESDDEEEYDEQAIEAIQEQRLAAMGRSKGKSDVKKDNIQFFNLPQGKDIVIHLQDLPSNLEANDSLTTHANLWDLNDGQRILYLFTLLDQKLSSLSAESQFLLQRLDELYLREAELQSLQEASILSTRKLIGMTITGASIHHKLVQNLRPSIVIVEEAGEVLEPDLIAALTPGLQHLILIGDHKQLRPQVDTYKLRTKYKFDLSLMERLINNNFPFQTLQTQNRMRPEFAKLLLDIYPGLKDNTERVSRNSPLTCISKSMFFWNHNSQEKSGRSHTNPEEVLRVVELVTFLLMNQVKPSEISVLAAYQGQATLIRKDLKKLSTSKPTLFQFEDKDNFITTNTIDMFQGDENKYIIVSLVRSNNKGQIGFLGELNRRCVAQSRAKCGMYFIGNKDTLSSRPMPWKPFIEGMSQVGCVSDSLPLQCSKHKAKSVYPVKSGAELSKLVTSPGLICKFPCGDVFPCGLHKCTKPCIPLHSHSSCTVMVDFRFPMSICQYQHLNQKRCHESVETLIRRGEKCKHKVDFTFPTCKHTGTRACWEDKAQMKCKTKVIYKPSTCNHFKEVPCHLNQQYALQPPRCTEEVSFRKSDCHHNATRECHQKESEILCKVKISYTFPACDHPSPIPKKCSEPITWVCKHTFHVLGSCGHFIQKECSQSLSTLQCMFRPCVKLRSCKHPCTNRCGEACDLGDCARCEEEMKKQLKKMQHRARVKIKKLEDKMKSEQPLKIVALSKTESSAEYLKIEDSVLKSVIPIHNWWPTITKIEKVTNLKLEKKYEEAKLALVSQYEDLKFHGTCDVGVKGITEDGFRLPNVPDMYGAGIYFATDSSKSAREIYTKGSKKLLVCSVLLGKSLNVSGADNKLTLKKLRHKGYDSVFAPRNSASTNGVMNDEFVVYDPNQAKVEYIVHYTYTHFNARTVSTSQNIPAFNKVIFKPADLRAIKLDNPIFMTAWHAESHFYKMARQRGLIVKSLTVIENSTLLHAFEAKKNEFKSKNIPADPIYAYHGTTQDPAVMDSILRKNFDIKYAKRQLHGVGNYFSEFPDVSLGYGPGLIFCQLLSGNEFSGPATEWPLHHSKVFKFSECILYKYFPPGCSAKPRYGSLPDGHYQELGSDPSSVCYQSLDQVEHEPNQYAFCKIMFFLPTNVDYFVHFLKHYTGFVTSYCNCNLSTPPMEVQRGKAR